MDCTEWICVRCYGVIGPRRIVCLTEETTELLYLLGEEERIVGISAYTVRPPQARNEKPIVSAFLNGSIPKIKALEPDLIIGFSDIQADLAKSLIAEGLNVLVTNQRSIEEIFETMQMVGAIVGKGEDTARWIGSFRAKLDSVQVEGERRFRVRSAKPRVFFQEWDEPLITGIRWVTELVEVAGGVDIFPEFRTAPMAKDRITTAKEVLARNPDVIIGSWCGKPMERTWIDQHLGELACVRAGNVHEIDSSIILQPGPALFLEGVDALARAIFNERLHQ